MEVETGSLRVELRPFKKLILHNINRLNLNDLIITAVTPAGVLPLFWSNGFIFNFSAPPLSDKILDLIVNQDELHWLDLNYCAMPTYTNIVSDESGRIQAMVRDTSTSGLHTSVSQILKYIEEQNKKV